MRKVIALIWIIGVTPVAIMASDLDDYGRRVKSAIASLGDTDANESSRIDIVKELLPPAESVEVENQTVEIDNRWLHVLLDSAANEPDRAARRRRLSEAALALRNLQSSLAVGEEQRSDSNARDKLREVLSRAEFQPKRDPLAELIKKVRAKLIELIQYIVQLFAPVSQVGSVAGPVLRIILIALPLLALYYVARTVLRLRGGKKKPKEKVTVLGEEIEEGASSEQLASAAMEAARSGDFRTGVRKLYIALLYELAQRNLIHIESHATNREYLARVSRFKGLAAPMRDLTESFDYAWYGMLMPSAEDFSAYLRRYREAVATARTIND